MCDFYHFHVIHAQFYDGNVNGNTGDTTFQISRLLSCGQRQEDCQSLHNKIYLSSLYKLKMCNLRIILAKFGQITAINIGDTVKPILSGHP